MGIKQETTYVVEEDGSRHFSEEAAKEWEQFLSFKKQIRLLTHNSRISHGGFPQFRIPFSNLTEADHKALDMFIETLFWTDMGYAFRKLLDEYEL